MPNFSQNEGVCGLVGAETTKCARLPSVPSSEGLAFVQDCATSPASAFHLGDVGLDSITHLLCARIAHEIVLGAGLRLENERHFREKTREFPHMITRLLASLIALATITLFSPLAHACACCDSYQVVGVANWDVLNVRGGPGTNYQIVGTLQPGEACIFQTGQRSGDDWVFVQANSSGVQGWVREQFLAFYSGPQSDPGFQGQGAWVQVAARSLGGIVRSGPGTNFPRVASLPEGTPITLLSDTGVSFDGYTWFEIDFDGNLWISVGRNNLFGRTARAQHVPGLLVNASSTHPSAGARSANVWMRSLESAP